MPGPELRRKVCEPVVDSPAVTGVVVDITFSSAPSGTPAVSGDSGFGSCLQLGASQFRCQGATIQPELVDPMQPYSQASFDTEDTEAQRTPRRQLN
jgi:hypothetical protein